MAEASALFVIAALKRNSVTTSAAPVTGEM